MTSLARDHEIFDQLARRDWRARRDVLHVAVRRSPAAPPPVECRARPCGRAPRAARCAASFCSRSCACRSGDAATLAARPPFLRATGPRRCTSSCARLRDQRRDRRGSSTSSRPPRPRIRYHGRAVLALVQRRQVRREPLRQHREMCDAGIDGGGLVRRVASIGRALRAPPRHVRDAHQHADPVRRRAPPIRPGRGRATRRCRSKTRAGQ